MLPSGADITCLPIGQRSVTPVDSALERLWRLPAEAALSR
jgi:hypothetical protein